MRRNRTGLLCVAALIMAASAPLSAQMGPSLTGETGLFELKNAETLPAGRFSLGLYGSTWSRVAADPISGGIGSEGPLLYRTSKLGLTVGFGLLNNWELSLAAGQRYYSSDAQDWAGDISGRVIHGEVDHDETDKVRLGTKFVIATPDHVKVALFGGFTIPMQARNDPAAISTYRSDWDFGASLNYGILTASASYVLTGDRAEVPVANEFIWGLGFAVPVIPKTLRVIAEVNRVHYDGGYTKPGDFSDVTLGARFGFGGLTASAALRANIDRWIKHESSLGGLIQIAYLPPGGPAERLQRVSPQAEEPAAESPAAAPAAEPVPSAPAPAPAPIAEPVAPAPRPATSTTDEVLFDAAKSRLTNIAKAILDGVALRLKNNLSATCTVVSYTDPKEKGGDHAALAKARGEAAKDYLVKRHGIDAARVRLDPKGDAEAGPDATRNRRAVVTVTFP